MEDKYKLNTLVNFKGREGPYLLIIMDGVGIGDKGPGDAFFHANTPNLDKWMEDARQKGLYTELKAHGPAVGLPTEKDMGNSEVGHNALGSGQIYAQGAKLVFESLRSGKFFKTEKWDWVVGEAARNNKAVHFIGLLSDGNVHSHIEQLEMMMEGAAKTGVKRLYVHALLDGRDVPPLSALKYIDRLEDFMKKLREKYNVEARIASGGGRMHVTMDRYESDWNIVKRGWDAHVRGVVDPEDISDGYPGYFKSAREAIETARKALNLTEDQYAPAFVIVDDNGNPIGKMQDGDGVINFNFRGDRAIEISKAFVLDDFPYFDRVYRPKVRYAGLLQYDDEEHIPPVYLVPPPDIQDVSAHYFCAMHVTTYAIAETHKFGHVTYFWNGNRTGYICEEYEKYEEIKSLPNELTETHPEMKAGEVTERLLQVIDEGNYKYIRCNYANGDMVGHTGNFEAGIKAMEFLDKCLEKVVNRTLEKNGVVVITADHGNIEEMKDKNGKPMTKHSLNPVPFIIIDSGYKGEYKIDTSDIDTPGISNVIATFMNLMGFEAPKKYRKSLIKFTNQ